MLKCQSTDLFSLEWTTSTALFLFSKVSSRVYIFIDVQASRCGTHGLKSMRLRFLSIKWGEELSLCLKRGLLWRSNEMIYETGERSIAKSLLFQHIYNSLKEAYFPPKLHKDLSIRATNMVVILYLNFRPALQLKTTWCTEHPTPQLLPQ